VDDGKLLNDITDVVTQNDQVAASAFIPTQNRTPLKPQNLATGLVSLCVLLRRWKCDTDEPSELEFSPPFRLGLASAEPEILPRPRIIPGQN